MGCWTGARGIKGSIASGGMDATVSASTTQGVDLPDANHSASFKSGEGFTTKSHHSRFVLDTDDGL